MAHQISDECISCGSCESECPVNAISGAVKQPHRIDADKCIKCGACKTACKFGAVVGL